MTLRHPVILAAFFLLALQAALLFFLGQPPLCECGYIKVWEGVVLSSGNSQHLADWYTFSHVIHGFLFYALLWYFFPKMSAARRFLAALLLEVGWEVFENTPLVIEHYRAQALAQGYVGDSILNSISDTLAMIGGFLLASRLPILGVVALGVILELYVGFSIRDNLFLNVVGLFHQFEFISEWQSNGG